jgi:hypothetical protein
MSTATTSASAAAKQLRGAAAPRTHGPRLTGFSRAICDNTAACAGKALLEFSLAAIANLQGQSVEREEVPQFTEKNEKGKAWMSFDHIIEGGSDRSFVRPVTVSTDVKIGLTAVLFAVVNLAGAGGAKVPSDNPAAALAARPYREASIVRVMQGATARMAHVLRREPLNRELSYPLVFSQKLNALVHKACLVDPGTTAVARLYMSFVKVIAWFAAVRAYESGHLTINREVFYSVFASLEAVVSEDVAADVPVSLAYIKAEVDAWELAAAQAKAAAKAPAKKPTAPAAAAPAAAAAAPAAAAAAAAAAPAAAAAATAARSPEEEELDEDDLADDGLAADNIADDGLAADSIAPTADDPAEDPNELVYDD